MALVGRCSAILGGTGTHSTGIAGVAKGAGVAVVARRAICHCERAGGASANARCTALVGSRTAGFPAAGGGVLTVRFAIAVVVDAVVAEFDHAHRTLADAVLAALPRGTAGSAVRNIGVLTSGSRVTGVDRTGVVVVATSGAEASTSSADPAPIT